MQEIYLKRSKGAWGEFYFWANFQSNHVVTLFKIITKIICCLLIQKLRNYYKFGNNGKLSLLK